MGRGYRREVNTLYSIELIIDTHYDTSLERIARKVVGFSRLIEHVFA